MKFNRILSLLLLFGGLIAYISCRKADSLSQEKTHPESILNDKFFNSHRSADPTEKALVDFIKRKIDKEHYIEKTVSQIGYPRWNKALSFKKPDTKKAGRAGSEDSVSIFYVPFVRDSQNFVNSSLIIKVHPNDTSFYYICDWQYQNKVHGSPTIDTTAERYAVFFMLLDNRTFGYTKFNLTDTDLFPEAVSSTGEEKKLGFVNISAPTAGRNSLMEYHEICVDFYICGTPDADECTNGCDYLNCPTGQCVLVTDICEGWWEETGGGGGSSGGETGGTGGSGGSGSGNGGSTPPDCGEPIPLAGRNNLVDPCTGGWEPIPTEDDPDINYVINNLTLNPPPDQNPLDLNDYLKCFENIPGSIYKVTISADQPIPGQSDCYTNNNGIIDVGHTFLTFEQIKPDGSSIRRSFGFYPSSSVKPITPTSSGIFINDESHVSDASLTTTINDGTLFMEKINSLRNLQSQGQGNYHLSLFNCTTFAQIVMNSFGVTIPLQSCFWATSGNPGDLGQYIRNMQLNSTQTRNVQTVNAPLNSSDC